MFFYITYPIVISTLKNTYWCTLFHSAYIRERERESVVTVSVGAICYLSTSGETFQCKIKWRRKKRKKMAKTPIKHFWFLFVVVCFHFSVVFCLFCFVLDFLFSFFFWKRRKHRFYFFGSKYDTWSSPLASLL